MKKSELNLVLGTVWISSFKPDTFNLIAGGVLIATAFYYLCKGK